MKNATTVLGGDEASFEALERVMEDAAPLGLLRRLAIFLRWPGFVRWVLWHSPERGELLIAGKRRRIGRLTRVDIASLSDDAIVSLLNGSAGNFLQVGSSILFAFVAMGYFMALDTVCRRWFGDADGPRPRRGGFGRAGGTLARRLVGGVNGMQSAEAGLALWRLAELAGRHEEVAGAILSEQTFEAVRTRIEHDRAGAEFLAQWQAFMREHGHHTRGELEFANPRWSETPDRVLRMVRGHIENGGRESPVARHERLAADRRRLTRECRSRLWNPIKRVIFDYMLKNAQRGCLLRENGKSEVVKGLGIVRRMLLELGRRIVARGVFRERDDVFFLRVEEVGPVVKGAAPADVCETIAERRAAYEKNLAITPPSVVVGRFDPDDFASDAVDGDTSTFEGIASSPGVVTGPARVITRAGEDTVGPGEILVAPFTDPGWTPFFVNAAGIVMDMGGLLSHGSIIAREYGIPAVVNVGPATKIIETGQMLRVDGDRGVVSVVGAEPGDAGVGGSRGDSG
jgi:pyruvate,water dikinase